MKFLRPFLLLALIFLSSAALFTKWWAAPAGPPANPPTSPPDGTLIAHQLQYAPAPLDNPLKGFMPFFFKGTDYASAFPHSMEWSYFALSEVMTNPTNCSSYNWEILDQM